MKAVILKEAGSVENLQFAEIEKPTAQSDEVLVKVVSVSINPVDVKARAYDGVLGWIFGEERPVILGWDISGEVVETGKNVTDFKIGDHVFGMVNFFGNGKAYAEYVASPAIHLALKPENVTHQQAVQNADIVLDTIQGETLLHSVDVVRSNGIIVTLPTPEIPQEVKEKADKKQVNIEFLMVASKNETIKAIAQLLEKGALKPHIHKTFPFEEIAKAHLEVETNRVVGKVVVNI